MPELDDEAITITLPEDYLDGTGDGGSVQVAPVEKVVEKAVDDPVADLKGQFETIKGQLSQTTQRAAQAEQLLAETDQQLQTARKEVVSSQLDTVTTGLQAAKAEAEAAEVEWAAAAEAGDFVKQAKATRRMNQAQIKIDRLEEAEGDLKDQTKIQPKREVQRQEATNGDNDPVARFTKGMSQRSAEWIRAHPDCVTDAKKNARMLAAHSLAIADDVAVDSDEYFSRIEAGIEPKAAVRAAQTQQDAPKAQVRPSSAAAPAGNAGGGMSGGGQDVMLTMREKLAAEDGTHTWSYDDPSPAKRFRKGDAIGVQEFARRKMIMKRQGLYDRTLTES